MGKQWWGDVGQMTGNVPSGIRTLLQELGVLPVDVNSNKALTLLRRSPDIPAAYAGHGRHGPIDLMSVDPLDAMLRKYDDGMRDDVLAHARKHDLQDVSRNPADGPFVARDGASEWEIPVLVTNKNSVTAGKGVLGQYERVKTRVGPPPAQVIRLAAGDPFALPGAVHEEAAHAIDRLLFKRKGGGQYAPRVSAFGLNSNYLSQPDEIAATLSDIVSRRVNKTGTLLDSREKAMEALQEALFDNDARRRATADAVLNSRSKNQYVDYMTKILATMPVAASQAVDTE
jgi:hypothetical protein